MYSVFEKQVYLGLTYPPEEEMTQGFEYQEVRSLRDFLEVAYHNQEWKLA